MRGRRFFGCLLVVMASLWMGQFAFAQDKLDTKALSGKVIVKQGAPNRQELFLVANPDIPDASNGAPSGELFRKLPDGRVEKLADQVTTSKYAPDGKILFIQSERLMEMRDGKSILLGERINGDFSFDKAGKRILVSRQNAELEFESSIEILDRDGKIVSKPVGPGLNAHPIFTPDNKRILYTCGDTGIISWFIVNVDGTGRRQLTNVGATQITASFVPVLSTFEQAGFIDDRHYQYRDGKDVWVLDIDTGKAAKQ